MNSIMVCGKEYDIGTKVVLWDEPKGLNGYGTSTKVISRDEDRRTGKIVEKKITGRRYSSRSKVFKDPKLPRLQKMITQFFLHHSGLYRARHTYNVLHNERGLSAHFILDDDGTIYQTLDLKEKAWHGGKNNSMSIGIEIDSRARAGKYPKAYNEYYRNKYKVQPRKISTDCLQGKKVKGFEYNDLQYKALIKLGRALVKLFPNMKSDLAYEFDFPRDSSGEIIKSALKYPTKHCGFICHYNTKTSKIDPICFDHERFLEGVHDRASIVGGFDSWMNNED